MEKVKIKAEELRNLIHEIKYTSQDVILKVRKLTDETVKTCTELSEKAHKLLEDLDTVMADIEVKKSKEE
jgi:hypothetical protein